MTAYRKIMTQDPKMIQDPVRNDDLGSQVDEPGPGIREGQPLTFRFIRTQDAGIFVTICRQVCNFNLKLVIIIFWILTVNSRNFPSEYQKADYLV